MGQKKKKIKKILVLIIFQKKFTIKIFFGKIWFKVQVIAAKKRWFFILRMDLYPQHGHWKIRWEKNCSAIGFEPAMTKIWWQKFLVLSLSILTPGIFYKKNLEPKSLSEWQNSLSSFQEPPCQNGPAGTYGLQGC